MNQIREEGVRGLTGKIQIIAASNYSGTVRMRKVFLFDALYKHAI